MNRLPGPGYYDVNDVRNNICSRFDYLPIKTLENLRSANLRAILGLQRLRVTALALARDVWTTV